MGTEKTGVSVIPFTYPSRPRNVQQLLAEAYRFLARNAAYRLGPVGREPGLISLCFDHPQRPAQSFTVYVRNNGIAHAALRDKEFLEANNSLRALLTSLDERIKGDGYLRPRRQPAVGAVGGASER